MVEQARVSAARLVSGVRYEQWLKILWLAAGLAIVTLLLLAGAGIFTIYDNHIFRGAETNAEHISQALIGQERENLFVADGAGGVRLALDERQKPGFDRRVKKYLRPFQIVKIKMFDRRKKILYSTDPNMAGKNESRNWKLEQALRGTPVSELQAGTDTRHLDGERRSHRDLIETYLPIKDDAGNIVGCFELYADVTPYRKELKRVLMLSLSTIFIVSVLVFGAILFLMSRMLKIFCSGIQEHEAMAEQLMKKSVALERTNEKLRDFTGIAAHDLSEPLRKIITFAERLKRQDGLNERGRDYLRRMQGTVDRMRCLLDDLQEFSRLNGSVRFKPVNLQTLASRITSDLEGQILRSGGRVLIEKSNASTALPIIEASESQMYQLLCNLISNALKYRQPKAAPLVKIKSEPRRADGFCAIVVEDNGIGFDERYLKRIFKPFVQLHGHEEFKGTGMGLAICAEIVAGHGGSITAESAPGAGSRFIVTLPEKQLQ